MATTAARANEIQRQRMSTLNATLAAKGTGLSCVTTSWEDAARAFDSAVGPNIADIGIVLPGAEGEPEQFGFKIRCSNFNEKLVKVDANKYHVVHCDPDGQNPRRVTLASVLKEAGNNFKHTGLNEGVDLSDPVDETEVKLRIDVLFCPVKQQEAGEPVWTVHSNRAQLRTHLPNARFAQN